MVILTKLKDDTSMEVRIKNGLIDEVFYKGNVEEKLLSRKDSEDIKRWLKDILVSNVENFKKILSGIKEDHEFYNYCKKLLSNECEKKVKILMDYRKESDRRIKQLQAEVEKYQFKE